jgi:Pre-mRNA-splicing factor of RES complex
MLLVLVLLLYHCCSYCLYSVLLSCAHCCCACSAAAVELLADTSSSLRHHLTTQRSLCCTALHKQNIKLQPFARTADHMDAELRDVIRADDPMAAYALKQQAKAAAAAGKPAKPVYKGPAPKPNRYLFRFMLYLCKLEPINDNSCTGADSRVLTSSCRQLIPLTAQCTFTELFDCLHALNECA